MYKISAQVSVPLDAGCTCYEDVPSLRITKSYVPSTCRRLLHYPAVNWNAVWAARPSHNGDSEEQR